MDHYQLILHYGQAAAYLIIFLVIFAESGILLGFFLPGDSFLFALGILAAHGYLNLPLVLTIGMIGAILGDSIGYTFGRRIGPRLFKKSDSLLFKQENLQRAQNFYNLHGKKTIILARFIPLVRTFAPIVGGIAGMHYPTFLLYNVVGGIGWVVSVTLLGYFLGNRIPNLEHYILPVIGLVIILSFASVFSHLLMGNRKAKTPISHD